MTTRRQFLQQSSLISLAPLVPAFLSQAAAAAGAKPEDRVLVVIQLDGGNDGLNTVIPFADENYAACRKELRIRTQDVLKLDDSVGLHSAMKPAAKLFEDGRLAIIQGVGYPNPNRSHFESMAIWHHARPSSNDHDGHGWIGRAADLSPRPDPATTDAIYVGADAIPIALRGRRAVAASLEDETDLRLASPVALDRPQPATGADITAFVHRTASESYAAARRLAESGAIGGSGAADFDSKLGKKLRLVSRLIKLGGGTRVYYVSQSGYDTHAVQAFTHLQLLDELSRALQAFLDDLRAAQLDDRVVVLAFSEFGRRVQENGSAGTDHGAAGPVFLAGAPVKGGLIGKHPSLTDLDQGDLKPAIDFRRIYATLLDRWLGVDSKAVLSQSFEPLPCLKNSA